MRLVDDPAIFSVPSARIRKNGGNETCGILPDFSEGGIFSGTPHYMKHSLYCRYFCQSRLQHSYWIRRKKQAFLSIEYIYSGAIGIRSDDAMFIAEAGDLVLLHPHRDNVLSFTGLPPCVKCGFIIDGGLLEYAIEAMALGRFTVIKVQDESVLEQHFQSLCKAVKLADSPGTGNIETYAALCGRTMETLQYIAMLPEIRQVSEKALAIRDYLRLHFAETLSIDCLCRHFGMSQPLLNRCFREGFQTTPWDYLVGFRLSHAASALRNSDDPIKKIASEAGYNSAEYFQAEFKRRHGISPGRYRRTYAEGNAPVEEHHKH